MKKNSVFGLFLFLPSLAFSAADSVKKDSAEAVDSKQISLSSEAEAEILKQTSTGVFGKQVKVQATFICDFSNPTQAKKCAVSAYNLGSAKPKL